jgi:hypothetical protein
MVELGRTRADASLVQEGIEILRDLGDLEYVERQPHSVT